MKLIKQSRRSRPRVSLILLDWSVRESFHLLHYLARQDVPRDDFEVLAIEYYSRVSGAIRKFEDQVDSWLLLEMPEDCYYHKHLMYNAGIVLARGDICVICDSDAMVKPGFIRTIAGAFEKEPNLVLHLDQFRNNRRDFYPFNYPDFEEVTGTGCINNAGGTTAGLIDRRDPIHTRNYGACMCARRADLIVIGGADEHIDFVGHICGPYDMTFRLVNDGKQEIWHPTEFLYHTWHPGQAGVDNYLGPHDGRHVSTTSLAALGSRRVRPLLENPAIRRLREHPDTPVDALPPDLIRPEGPGAWQRSRLERGSVTPQFDAHDLHIGYYRGYSIYRDGAGFYAHLAVEPHRGRAAGAGYAQRLEAGSLEAIRARVRAAGSVRMQLTMALASVLIFAWQAAFYLFRRKRTPAASPLTASGGSAQSWAARLKLFAFRLSQLSTERRMLADAIADLVPNLHYARGLARASGSATPPRLVVGDRRTEFILGLLRALRAIPQVQLVRAESGDQVERIVAEAADRGHPERLVLARSLYYSSYPSIAKPHLERAFSVV